MPTYTLTYNGYPYRVTATADCTVQFKAIGGGGGGGGGDNNNSGANGQDAPIVTGSFTLKSGEVLYCAPGQGGRGGKGGAVSATTDISKGGRGFRGFCGGSGTSAGPVGFSGSGGGGGAASLVWKTRSGTHTNNFNSGSYPGSALSTWENLFPRGVGIGVTGYFTRTESFITSNSLSSYEIRESWIIINGKIVFNALNELPPSNFILGAKRAEKYITNRTWPGGGDTITCWDFTTSGYYHPEEILTIAPGGGGGGGGGRFSAGISSSNSPFGFATVNTEVHNSKLYPTVHDSRWSSFMNSYGVCTSPDNTQIGTKTVTRTFTTSYSGTHSLICQFDNDMQVYIDDMPISLSYPGYLYGGGVSYLDDLLGSFQLTPGSHTIKVVITNFFNGTWDARNPCGYAIRIFTGSNYSGTEVWNTRQSLSSDISGFPYDGRGGKGQDKSGDGAGAGGGGGGWFGGQGGLISGGDVGARSGSTGYAITNNVSDANFDYVRPPFTFYGGGGLGVNQNSYGGDGIGGIIELTTQESINLRIRQNGGWVKPSAIYVRGQQSLFFGLITQNVWKKVNQIYLRENGSWKLIVDTTPLTITSATEATSTYESVSNLPSPIVVASTSVYENPGPGLDGGGGFYGGSSGVSVTETTTFDDGSTLSVTTVDGQVTNVSSTPSTDSGPGASTGGGNDGNTGVGSGSADLE